MSLFSKIGAGIKAVFGGGQDGNNKVLEAAKGVGKWIDEQKFTDEEKAQYNAEMVKHFGEYMAGTVNENTERSRSRRDIALWVIRFYIILLGFSALIYKFDGEWAAYAFKIAVSHPLNYLVLGIGAFFFGAHILRTYQSKKNG